MTNFNFIQSKKAYETRYFQFPQVLLYGEEYKNLSDSAKLGYMVLRDRLDYSLQNNWVDEQNRVYFIYTNLEFKNLFGWSDRKITKIKKELEDASLLYQIRQGFDPKKKKNLPNKLYLADLDVTAKDIYLKQNQKQTVGMSGQAQMQVRDKENTNLGTVGMSGQAQMQVRDNTVQTVGMSGQAQMQVNQYKDYLDTNKDNTKDTQKLDFSSANFSASEIKAQNSDLVKNAKTYLKEGSHEVFLNQESLHLIEMWCNTPQQIHRFIGIILNAKNDVMKEQEQLGVYFNLDEEELQDKILNTLRRYFNSIRTNEKKIQNFENYLYATMVNMFSEYWNEQAIKS